MTEQEFEICVEKYSDLIYRIAFGYLKDKEDAEDVYQNVFLKLYRYKKDFKDEEHRKRWLIRVTVNECHSVWRLPWKQKRYAVEDIQNVVETAQHENEAGQENGSGQEEAVKEMLAEIPSKYGTVLYLYYYEEYSTKEIAVILKQKESTVRSQLKRGREMLKKKIMESDFTGGQCYEG